MPCIALHQQITNSHLCFTLINSPSTQYCANNITTTQTHQISRRFISNCLNNIFCRGQTVIEWQGFLILFGGGEYGVIFNDLWVLDLKSLLRDTAGRWIITSGWRQVNAHTSDEEAEAGSQPRSRSGHACCVLGDHFMHILGG